MSVRDQSKAIQAMATDWPIIQALLGGTSAMRQAGEKMLPKWPNEDDESYKARLQVATLFPAFGRTIEVLAGKPFSKPVTLADDVPPRLVEWTEDIDLQGRNLHAFCAAVCEEALAYGISGILVDCPTVATPDGTAPRTVADEEAIGLRPYFVQTHPQNILEIKTVRIQGVDTIARLRLLEVVSEDGGDFDEVSIEQVRVLMPGVWQVWRETNEVDTNGKKIWKIYDEGTTSLSYVPFVAVYGKRIAHMVAEPPLKEMAYMNVKHWQSQSDQDTLLHVARVPVLCVSGVENNDQWRLTIGASSAVKIPHGADLKYVEHSGKAIEAGRMALLDLEDQMRQAGAELLVIKPGNITESQTLADNEQGMCALQRIINDLEDSLDTALQMMADFVKEPQGGHATVYKDFGAATLAEASAELLLKMSAMGKLSDESLYEELQRRGIRAPDVKWEEELGRIEGQPMLGLGALGLKEEPTLKGNGSPGPANPDGAA